MSGVQLQILTSGLFRLEFLGGWRGEIRCNGGGKWRGAIFDPYGEVFYADEFDSGEEAIDNVRKRASRIVIRVRSKSDPKQLVGETIDTPRVHSVRFGAFIQLEAREFHA